MYSLERIDIDDIFLRFSITHKSIDFLKLEFALNQPFIPVYLGGEALGACAPGAAPALPEPVKNAADHAL